MKTVQLFFELIRFAIKGDKLSDRTLQGVSEEQLVSLFKLSKNHDCAHLITYALYENKLIDKEHPQYKKFVYEQSLAVFRYENINYELEHICKFLEDNKIQHIPLKGSVIRALYPEPWMRTSCDIDILVHTEDSERAIKLLTEEYSCKLDFVYDYEASLYTSTNVHLELHLSLTPEHQDVAIDNVLKNVWDKSISRQGYVYSLAMADEYFYFYHLAHMAKHFGRSGCGVRPFIDLLLLDNLDDINEEKRFELLEQGKLSQFAKVAKKLVNVWFSGDEHDEFSKEVEDFILHCGVYGNKENFSLSMQNKKGSKLGYALSRIFLNNRDLSRQFPILIKHKWLNPFCQVARWFRIIFGGGVKRSVNELKEIKNRPDDQLKQREDMMKNLGLWK